MKFELPDKLFERVLTLATWAVEQHVQDNGTTTGKVKADVGWEDAYDIMEALEAIEKEQVVR